ncbi:hypothetical protein [Blastococcus sp. TF02A-30]|uniref:hypothetical protein n=1 Tax=Blastococcus sp. TF02A-30 TaxID=2250580 RepID=UPI000DEADDF9|nr:hypothetical protein [Blastococcus sp. TF02A-30]RBY86475.1 hypothetical protein DQ241_13170 [Blastococcus sp. TF02A-30]
MTSPDAFAALARSSPWRWSTLRFTVTGTGPHRVWEEPVRAWLRRPDALRVESLAADLVQVVRGDRQRVGVFGPGGGRTEQLPWAGEPGAPAPVLRPDGLVDSRPDSFELSGDPMFQNYYWIALLDPAELADGVEVEGVAAVQHGGRPAWEAVLRPAAAYEPRCGCCSLLRSAAVDEAEWGSPQLDRYPESYRVRLDVGTGVCVLVQALTEEAAVAGHDLRIEAVDEPMGDELFVDRRPWPRWSDRTGWAPAT